MDSLILKTGDWDSFVGPPAVENIQCSGLNLPALGPSQNLGVCVLWTGVAAACYTSDPFSWVSSQSLRRKGG